MNKLIIPFLAVVFTFCSVPKQKQNLNASNLEFAFPLEFKNDSSFWKKSGNLSEVGLYTVEKFSGEDEYGSAFKSNIPSDFHGRIVKVTFSGEYKIDSSQQNTTIVLTSSDGEEVDLWKGADLSDSKNNWRTFKDSLIVPTNRSDDYTVSAFVWNKNKSKISTRGVMVSMTCYELPSFSKDIPTIKTEKSAQISFLHNPHVFINTGSKKLFIQLKEKGSEYLASHSLFDASFKLSKNTGHLKGGIKFKQDVNIERCALVGKFDLGITQISDNVGRAFTIIPKHEFWLGNGSINFQDFDKDEFYFISPEKLASIQVRPNDSTLIFNLDYSKDHPLLYFPELDSSKNEFEDISANNYQIGDSLSCNIYFKKVKKGSAPRVLPFKNGYQSAMIWTEHADYADLRLHKATYFGAENINSPLKAVGGFCKYNIPVTKSIFYTSDDTLRNSHYREKTEFNSLISSVKSTDGYIKFLDSVANYGSEICLHSPDFYTTTKETMDTALAWVKTRYNSKSWIDHGYNNSSSSNREDFMCEGLNSFSKNLWDKYDIQYMWNGYYEDVYVQKDFQHGASNIRPYPGLISSLPFNNVWQNKKSGENRYSWGTNSVFYPQQWEWDYYYNDKRLNRFIADFGIEVIHCYPAHVAQRQFWVYNDDSLAISKPEFDQTLERMAAKRDEGSLWIPTVGDFIDHHVLLSNVVVRSNGSGYEVVNLGDKVVKSLTIAISKKSISKSSAQAIANNNLRETENDYILWFDLKPGESKTIK